ncbi:hypothetical protein Egran_04771 [Elaphomyces granulatus]|uniref:Fork-head domain-containing protein n=1 Tax=Elaphomyces granulatus TaxID=519963 RepID=A0A232LTQ7_9EURO|nr:hypothetical protein Egran_04771 [Elaphomyces granulatus]
MLSSQTMTAPAVNHRPRDTGPNESVYEYSAPHSNEHLATPRDNSAILLRCGPELERPTTNGSIFSEDYLKKQEEIEKQSAASSLLAQLLGPSSPPLPRPPYSPVEPPRDLLEEKIVLQAQSTTDKADKHAISHDEASSPLESPAPLDLARDHLRPGNQETDPRMKEESFSRVPDAVTGVMVDPLSKTSQEIGLLPYDATAVRKNVMEAPQQNELLLTSSLLSQGADLYISGLPDLSAYSQSQPYDSAGSIAGSEPRIQAFAKLEFDDGHFYVNTYSFILGRDVRAARAAYQRELQARQAMGRPPKKKSSSGGNTSQTPNRVKREGSGIIASVVSDRGGIMGFDPDVPPHLPPQLSKKSSNSSHGDSGRALHAAPAHLHTDYNALAMQSLYEGNGDAKPVDTLALLPSPDACPTIPIHPPAMADGSAAGHKGISRKHVKIAYNFDKNLFEMEVIGRNGAFIGADWLAPGQIRPLHSGDYIQIGGVRIRFLLPDVPIGETGADRVEDLYVDEDENSMAMTTVVEHEKITADLDHCEGERANGKGKSKVTKIVLKTTEPRSSEPRPTIEGHAETSQQPPRRRGPGRPPKDGIMSKRERAEIAREQKLAAKREANGGVTPPPSNRSKTGKPRSEDPVADPTAMKLEKRKYTKRKKLDGVPMDASIPSVEGGELLPLEQLLEDYPKAPVKKRKPSRSPSPDYPPESAYTPEDLAKPPYNYAVLIFDALTESPAPMTLKQIYRSLKMKYPYFRFKCETEGWTSSVRHNLNGNGHLFMHAERDGKGWSWQLRPGASIEKEKKRRPSPPPPSPRPPSPSQPLAKAPNTEQYVPPRAQAYINQAGVADRLPNHQFQFPYIAPSPYNGTGPAPQHSSPYPPPSPALPLPGPIRNSLPPAFAKAMATEYTSPYASDPPPVLAQLQEQQARQAETILTKTHPPSYPSKNLPKPNPSAHPPNPPVYVAPSHPPTPPRKPNIVSKPMVLDPIPNVPESAASFRERAHKAIDDFEAVFMEDYDDKDYIREVLKSARARVLGGAQASSFTGGEPKDEAVIVDALRNLIESLEKE